jgi:hypothetical protein
VVLSLVVDIMVINKILEYKELEAAGILRVKLYSLIIFPTLTFLSLVNHTKYLSWAKR